ncbi:SMI1/KNR4 family protein [Streptomyces laurentii]|uniref:SMI1/KNR4 family protein n=1 Tax=Streptomyces laurentii TaxID=39478 RepID=UPI0036B55BAF
MNALYDFATWEPLLRLLRGQHAERLAAPGGYVSGFVRLGAWSVPLRRARTAWGRREGGVDMREEAAAVDRVRHALGPGEQVSFVLTVDVDGRAELRLYGSSPAVESGYAAHPGTLVLVEGALPEPVRRRPETYPDVRPAPTADPELLARTLRERLPDAIGATEEDLVRTEARLGLALPEELKALYRVTRARSADHAGDDAARARHADAVDGELLALDRLFVAEPSTRKVSWERGAAEAVRTPPDAAVQGLIGSPGWLVFADTGGGDGIAVDLTPGPRGHLGQIVLLDHEQVIGAGLLADSLTDFVVRGRRKEDGRRRSGGGEPAVADLYTGGPRGVEAVAHPALEVLSIGVGHGVAVGLAPLMGLPRLRTLEAQPGTLADPLEITRLTHLEYLRLGPDDWRVLLDAGAVPRTLSAASVDSRAGRDPRPMLDLADELLALFGRPGIPRTVVTGDLGPGPARRGA